MRGPTFLAAAVVAAAAASLGAAAAFTSAARPLRVLVDCLGRYAHPPRSVLPRPSARDCARALCELAAGKADFRLPCPPDERAPAPRQVSLPEDRPTL